MCSPPCLPGTPCWVPLSRGSCDTVWLPDIPSTHLQCVPLLRGSAVLPALPSTFALPLSLSAPAPASSRWPALRDSLKLPQERGIGESYVCPVPYGSTPPEKTQNILEQDSSNTVSRKAKKSQLQSFTTELSAEKARQLLCAAITTGTRCLPS